MLQYFGNDVYLNGFVGFFGLGEFIFVANQSKILSCIIINKDDLLRKQLKQSRQYGNFGSNKHHQATQDLINKLTQGQDLSLAEEEYVRFTLDIISANNSELEIQPLDFKGCENYWFKQRYLLHFRDLNCLGRVYDAKGEIDLDQKIKDKGLLEQEYQKWKQKIYSKSNGEKLFEYLSLETLHHINKLDKYCDTASIGHLRKEYLTKSLVLHGKYIYLLVKEYFQELGSDEEKIDVFTNTVLIDSYCYVHILFRHFAALIKEHQISKSYHYDENIDYRSIPDFLKGIVLQFSEVVPPTKFDKRSINFVFNKKTYTIWFRPFTVHRPGKIVESSLRLQSFYPVELAGDVIRTAALSKVFVSEKLTFLIPKT